MAEDLWDGFAETISIEIPFGEKPSRPPTAEFLDDYERRTEFRLPESYRQFLLAFGPGTLGRDFEISSPNYPGWRPGITTIEKLNKRYQKGLTGDDLEKYFDDPKQAKRLVLFCRTIGADEIGWDPLEVTDRRHHEYAIYMLPRLACSPLVAERLSGSFREFVEDHCLKDSDIFLKYNLPWDEQERGSRRVFLQNR